MINKLDYCDIAKGITQKKERVHDICSPFFGLYYLARSNLLPVIYSVFLIYITDKILRRYYIPT